VQWVAHACYRGLQGKWSIGSTLKEVIVLAHLNVDINWITSLRDTTYLPSRKPTCNGL